MLGRLAPTATLGAPGSACADPAARTRGVDETDGAEVTGGRDVTPLGGEDDASPGETGDVLSTSGGTGEDGRERRKRLAIRRMLKREWTVCERSLGVDFESESVLGDDNRDDDDEAVGAAVRVARLIEFDGTQLF